MEQKYLKTAYDAHLKIENLKNQVALVKRDNFHVGINNTYCDTSILKAVKKTILTELQLRIEQQEHILRDLGVELDSDTN